MNDSSPDLNLGKSAPLTLRKEEVIKLIGIAFAYFVAHQFASFFPDSKQMVMLIWPAGGVGLAAYLLNPKRLWPALVMVFSATGFLAEWLLVHRSPLAALGYTAANVFEGFFSALVILSVPGSFSRFQRVKEVLALVASAIVVNGLTSCIGAGTSVLMGGASFIGLWKAWFVSDSLGILIVAPFIVTWWNIKDAVAAVRSRAGESLVFVVFWLIANGTVFRTISLNGYLDLHPYILLALLMWAALRLGQRAVTMSLVLLFLIAVASPRVFHGPSLWTGADTGLEHNLLQVQHFLGFLSVVGFFLSGSIADRNRVEKDLRESEKRFRMLVEKSPVAIGITRNGKSIYSNRKLLELFGFASEEVFKARDTRDFWAPEFRGMVEDYIRRRAEGKYAPTDYDAVGLRADGSRFLTHVAVALLELPDGPATLAVFTDITERKQTEQELAMEKHLLNSILSASVDLVFFKDRNGLFIRVNEASSRFHGFANPLALIGKTDADLFQGEILKKAEEDEKRIIATGHPLVADEFEVRKINGERVWLSTTKFPFYDSDGKIIGTAGISRDVSAHRVLEATLAREEQLLNSLLSISTDIIFFKDREGRFIRVNTESCRLHGLSDPSELIGKTDFDLFKGNLPWETQQDERHIMATGQPIVSKEQLQTKLNGESVWMSNSKWPLYGTDGKVIGIVGIGRDITEKKRAEAALIESEQRIKATFDNAGIGILEAGKDDRFVNANGRALEILGYSLEELCGMTIQDLTAPEDRELSKRVNADVKGGVNDRVEYEKRYLKKDGSRFWGHVTITRIVNASGEFQRYIATIDDITERKQMEEANHRLMVAIDQAAESIVFTDLNGTILYVNQGFERSSGYTRQEALGQNPRILKSGKQPDEYYKQMWETITRGEVWHGRFSNKRKDGSLYEEEATISPVRNSEGDITSFVAVKRDITRELQLEQQIIEAQKMEAVGQLAGGLAHDYNNIMAANMLQLDLILEKKLPADLRTALEALQEGEKRGINLTRQLLMFSRRQVMQKKPVNLTMLLDGELQMLRHLLGEQIDFVVKTRCKNAWVEADSGMMEQVIMNLCINARDAMPKGGRLTIKMALATFDASTPLTSIEGRRGDFVCLSVIDEGCGMNRETIKKIFEPFFTTKEVGKGTGLGLSTVYGIVKQHNGWIEVESELGKGSTFRVYLPVYEKASAPIPRETVSEDAIGGSETILLVEDELAVRAMMLKCLQAKGYQVLEANNGREALELWGGCTNRIDLLLTDMVMPEALTGMELADVFQKIKPGLPVVIMSGYSQEMMLSGAPMGRGRSYLAKPCNATGLATAVRLALDQTKREG